MFAATLLVTGTRPASCTVSNIHRGSRARMEQNCNVRHAGGRGQRSNTFFRRVVSSALSILRFCRTDAKSIPGSVVSLASPAPADSRSLRALHPPISSIATSRSLCVQSQGAVTQPRQSRHKPLCRQLLSGTARPFSVTRGSHTRNGWRWVDHLSLYH